MSGETGRFEDELLVTLARQRGLTFDPARAAALRPQVESLLARLARFATVLPRERALPASLEPRASAAAPDGPGRDAVEP